MVEAEYNIVLKTTGGTESASEVNKAAMALNSVTTSSSHMEQQFQHRFQHMGLMIFAGDALRASGLGNETRQVINTMNLALTGIGQAAGLAGGPLILIITAMTALVAIAGKVIEKHKDATEAIQKLSDANDKALKPHLDLVDAMKAAEAAGVKLTDQEHALLVAEQLVVADISSNQLKVYKQMEDAIHKQIDANIKHAETMHQLHAALDGLKQVWDSVVIAMGNAFGIFSKLKDTFHAMYPDLTKLTSGMVGHAGAVKLTAAETEALRQKNDLLKAKLLEVQVQAKHMGTALTDVYKNQTKAAEEAAKKAKSLIDKEEKFMLEMRKADLKDHTAYMKKITDEVKKAADIISSSMGSAFAAVIVQGKDMGEEMAKAAENMAMHFIEAVIKMIIEWALLKAIMNIFPGGAAAFQGAAQAAYPSMAQMTMAQAGSNFAGKHATGGQVFADRPTMAMFGEGGPEVATFSPLSGSSTSGMGGGGGGVTIGSINITANGVNDPKRLANDVGREIIQQIRGAGQLKFV